MTNEHDGALTIREMLDRIERERAAMPAAERAALEAAELQAQRESWVRATAPCKHGVADFEDCADCRTPPNHRSGDEHEA